MVKKSNFTYSFFLTAFIFSTTNCFSENSQYADVKIDGAKLVPTRDGIHLVSAENQTKSQHILNLPPELLPLIGSHLNDLKSFRNVSQVCKLFKNVLSPEILKQYFKRPLLIDLNISNSLQIFKTVVKHKPQENTQLKLRVDNITDRSKLREILSKDPNLQELDLSKNNLTGNKLDILLPSLLKLNSLKVLNLSDCSLDLDDMKKLAGRTQYNNKKSPMFPKLTSLILSNNSIGTSGVELLAKSHHHFPDLKVLDISKTGLGSKGLRLLLTSPLGKSLTTLKAQHNYITADGIPADIPETDLNHLEKLDLTNNSFNPNRVPIAVGSLKEFFQLIHSAGE